MRSNLEQINIVFNRLKDSALDTAITGNITKNVRLVGSVLEDVVINSLATINTQLQKGIMNVNIHVPNLKINISGGTDQSTPNHNRINELTEIAIPLLKDIWGDNWDFDIEQINLIMEEKSSYNNIRLVFQSLNV